MRGEQLRALGAGVVLVLLCIAAVVVGFGVPGLIGFLIGRASA